MSDFSTAISVVLQHEGLTFTDDPADHGGATKFGLTLGFLQGTVDKDFDVERLQDLTQEEAEGIYKEYWWDKYLLYTIVDQTMATKVFDTMANLGPNHATRIVQKSVNDVGTPIHIDGIFGPQTITQLNSPKCSQILTCIKSNLVNFYEGLVAKNPSQEKFIKGWLNRANG